MKTSRLAALLLSALVFSGCGLLKQKAADHYLGKAGKTAAAQNPPQADVEAAFANIEKAVSYAPDSAEAVELLGRLADSASKNGFAGAQELEASALKKILAARPLNWSARESLINFFAARGDIGGLEAMAAQAQELSASGGEGQRYCALLAGLAARASALPWLESEAYLSLNKAPETLFEKAAAYEAGAARVQAMKAEADKLTASDPSVKKSAPAALVSAAEVAAADALRDPEARAAIAGFNARAGSDTAFRKAVELAVRGNAALVKKEYSQARAFYQGALNHYPALIDARRQLAETDFQEGAALAVAGGGNRKAAAQLLYRAYGGASAVIAEALKTGNLIPFIKPAKFLGDTYSLKAADLAALHAVEGARLRNTAKLEAEFKSALDEALKLNPEGRLARELLERYTKEGF
ncbi:MAG: hypothetical protein Q7R35_06870 [Elusimicrobiota bacterium]|nr:hypothetical protein [Elusimicrobiota bacterium]